MRDDIKHGMNAGTDSLYLDIIAYVGQSEGHKSSRVKEAATDKVSVALASLVLAYCCIR